MQNGPDVLLFLRHPPEDCSLCFIALEAPGNATRRATPVASFTAGLLAETLFFRVLLVSPTIECLVGLFTVRLKFC